MDKDIFTNLEVLRALEEGATAYSNKTGGEGMTPAQVREATAEAQTIAQLRGLSREDLEVLYTYGFNMIGSGKLQQAEDIFINLCMIDPLEAKNHYCLGVVRQMQKRWHFAAEDFNRFLAMDATNPEGYLRIGECERALGRHDSARDYFETALAHAEKGRGPDTAVAEAKKALETLS